MEYDIAQLSPSMSKSRLMDNHGAALIRLAKKTMEQKSEMLAEILDAPVISPDGVGESIDIKL